MRCRKKTGEQGGDWQRIVHASHIALCVIVLILGLWEVSADAATISIDCDLKETIGGALSRLRSGDTMVVTGTCRESVSIQRQACKITLDGQGKATIQGPDPTLVPTSPTAFAIFVEGTDITIKGFTIFGGSHGIHLSGPATAVIDGNVISKTGGAIHFDKGSVGSITNNRIEHNLGMGIHLIENSYARIGFRVPTVPIPMSNIINNNIGHGIAVDRHSSAWIMGNTVTGNNGHGVQIDRNSQADVVNNTIEGNTGDGINVRHNSGVNLSSEGSERIDGPNMTHNNTKNKGYGIGCEVGGYVAGPQGSLIGAKGRKRFGSACTDRVTDK